MNCHVKKIFLLLFLFLLSKPSYAVFAGKIITIQHTWPSNDSFDTLSFFQQVTYNGGANALYFWGNQFQFKNGETGYIGLFNKGVHTVHFSIRNATEWKSEHCQYFMQEGPGVRCEIVFPWKIGHQYQLTVSKTGNMVTGTIINLMTGKETLIGIIEIPPTFGNMHQSFSFVEDHSHAKKRLSSCFVLKPQSSIFWSPVGDNKFKAALHSSTQGSCNDPYIVQALCNKDFCINTINHLSGVASPATERVTIVNGKDLSASIISYTLKKHEFITIYLEDGHWAQNIFFPPPGPFKWKSIFMDNRAPYDSFIHVNNKTRKLIAGQKIMYRSDGQAWKIIKTQ
ncbi:DUF3472 domain-containing protein [Bartonella raoultii]|uniref:DUF3472 domain-containing protein n=1 Tax=Bartonella raoultii TaxID=1457020 RepID=A0ABS7I6H4_9HYPH|nr:DUF3472 domain-containing protein [Bartonella raoultii]MBX4336465.1 DUF3472 domain-containing protein [Bartonella raoultii]